VARYRNISMFLGGTGFLAALGMKTVEFNVFSAVMSGSTKITHMFPDGYSWSSKIPFNFRWLFVAVENTVQFSAAGPKPPKLSVTNEK
jgi:hypothetical protein